MFIKDFEKLKNDFENSNTDEKIKIYTTTVGLTAEQYKELLRAFPIKELNKLEAALQ